MKVVVIGAGVIGCAVAYYLRKLKIDVTVLDRGAIGGQASSAAAGLLAPLGPLSGPGPFADLVLASFALFPELVTELEDVSGVRVEYEQHGALRVVCHPKRIARLRKRLKAWQPLGLQVHWLDSEEAHRHEPLLAPDICAAVYAPEEAQVRAPLLTQAFARAAVNLGATFRSDSEIVGLKRDRDRITSVQTGAGEAIVCDHLVMSTGAWAGKYSEWLGVALPVSPLRGQMLSLRQPGLPLRHIIFGEAAYLAPKKDGTIIVGATREETGFDVDVTAGGLDWLLKTAIKLVPALQGCAIEGMWAGLRPRTPDGYPLLGPIPGWQNVTVATGHNSVGMLLSPITGRAIAESIVHGRVPEIIRAFLPVLHTAHPSS